ncbi:hypothetical protein OAT16_09965 [Prolixibacteraceae bacterium]|nr:hypothetical protein [Prolixibacteraceae bacterium]
MHLNDLVYILDCGSYCVSVDIDGVVVKLNNNLANLISNSDSYYIRINDFTIVNTKYIKNKSEGRTLSLKGGTVHRVSRTSWKKL